VCDKCDENGENCQAESVSGRPSGCTDNPGMDQGGHVPEPTPSPTGMFDGSDPDTPRDPGCCMALDWSVHDATKCINAYKSFYCDNEPGWENCQWIHDDEHELQSDCENPDNDHAEDEDCGCTKELMPYCCDGQKYDNECLGYCAGASECLGMKHPDNSCTDQSDSGDETCDKKCMDGFECAFDVHGDAMCQKVEDSGDDEGCCFGETDRKMNMCGKSPSESNCNNMNGCYWSGECKLPTPEPGCCYGSDDACNTDDEKTCTKGKRKGCEWRSGKDADCTPEPGCCSGGDDACYDYDESMCKQNMRRKKCEWVTGTTDCTPPAPEPGCCYASDPNNRKADQCYGLDDKACANGARMSCAWKSGEDASCEIEEPEPEEGCCMGETERKMNMCSNSPSSMNCNNMNGCYWIDGADADCSMDDGDDDGAMCCGDNGMFKNMCSNSMSMNNCNGMNGCAWVTEASDCDGAHETQFLFAGEGVQEVMNSQVSLATVLLSLACLVALWKVYGWWSNAGDAKKVNAQVDAQGYYQSV